MEVFLSLIILLFILPSLILPWILQSQIRELRQELNKLKQQKSSPQKPAESEISKPQVSGPHKPIPSETLLQQRTAQLAQTYTAKKKSLKKTSFSFDQNLIANLPVWIGALALALAGFFLIKYSIETGLLSATVRLTIGGLFGTGFIVGGYWLHKHSEVSNNVKIGQALPGAGIAILYFCLYAALNFYSLISPLIAFSGMTIVTATTIFLSLIQGPPIAVMGLIGGFLTPALIESREPNVQFLLVYLYFVNAALFAVIWKRNWWYLAIPVVCASFAWIVAWMLTYFTSPDGVWVSLFLIAICATLIVFSKQAIENRLITKEHALILNVITLAGTVFLFTAVTINANFSDTQWGLFALLALASIALAYFKYQIYGFVPWSLLAVTTFLFLVWKEPNNTILSTYLILYASIFSFISYGIIWRSSRPNPWGLLATLSPLVYYLVGYVKFHNLLEGNRLEIGNDFLWGGLAFGLFGIFVVGVAHILNRFQGSHSEKQKLLTSFTLTSMAFLVMGIALVTNQEIFKLTLAAEVFLISWLNRFVNIRILPNLSAILAVGFGLLMLPEALPRLLLFSKTMASLAEPPLDIFWSLTNLGVPALLIAGASYNLRSKENQKIVGGLEVFAIAMFTAMTNSIVVYIFGTGYTAETDPNSFLQYYLIMNVFLIYGLICLRSGRLLNRKAVFYSGLWLLGIGLFQLMFEYTLIYNPLWYSVDVGPVPLFNGIIICFGLPILWLYFSKGALTNISEIPLQLYINAIIFMLVFIFASLTIRQLYQGSFLNSPDLSNAEIYTYSVVWILMGLGFLFFGALKKDQSLLVASLAFITISIFKVFLYDARELEDLYRVISFFGLGVSLLGLSWFYTRFIFQSQKTKKIRRNK